MEEAQARTKFGSEDHNAHIWPKTVTKVKGMRVHDDGRHPLVRQSIAGLLVEKSSGLVPGLAWVRCWN